MVGYSEKSCTETCNDPELGGQAVCRNDIMQTINTSEDFDAMLSSYIMLGSPNNPPGNTTAFCDWGVNLWPFATQAAAFAYQQYVALPTPHYIINNYCWYQPDNFPAYPPATCDTQYTAPPSQRFCSCAIANCVDTGAFPEPHYRRLEGEEQEQEQVESSSSRAAEVPEPMLALAAPAEPAVPVSIAEKAEPATVTVAVPADATTDNTNHKVPALQLLGAEADTQSLLAGPAFLLPQQLLELGINLGLGSVSVSAWQAQVLSACLLVAAVLSATLVYHCCTSRKATAVHEVVAETAKSLRTLRVRRKKEIRIEVTTH